MAKIIFEGWEHGMQKIPFIKLLNLTAALSLKESKKNKDLIVDGEIVTINLMSDDLANEIIKQARQLGVKCKLDNDDNG
ncbi:hypothetical protein [Flavobacterium chungangensis]|uniref:Ribosomal protein L7/L12 C-terminal domain-containing protein n=1 Tax=Flavobacterium chungangensis TaxID=2708132 RepID=A0ABV8ZCA4_9FLAO